MTGSTSSRSQRPLRISSAPHHLPVAPSFAPVSLQTLPEEILDSVMDLSTRNNVPYKTLAGVSSAFRQTALAHARRALQTAPKLMVAGAPCLLQTDWLRLSGAHRWLTSVVHTEAHTEPAANVDNFQLAMGVAALSHATSSVPKDAELNALLGQLNCLGPESFKASLEPWVALQPDTRWAQAAGSKMRKAYRSGATVLSLANYKIVTLPTSIGQLKALQVLDASLNSLAALPQSIGQLTALRYLHADNNALRALPESVIRLANLEKLEVFRNQLTTLPESIGQLKALQELNALGNQLTALPESIGQLTA